ITTLVARDLAGSQRGPHAYATYHTPPLRTREEFGSLATTTRSFSVHLRRLLEESRAASIRGVQIRRHQSQHSGLVWELAARPNPIDYPERSVRRLAPASTQQLG